MSSPQNTDDRTPFERWYDHAHRGRPADTKHINDCEEAWNAALATVLPKRSDTRRKKEACEKCEDGKLHAQPGGGVKCDRCSYWFCF